VERPVLAPAVPAARARRWPRLVLQGAISAIALFLVARMVSGREFLEALAGARPGPLVIALGLVVADRIFMAGKWGILLAAQGLMRSLGELIRIYFVASFYGSFLPTGVGGDLIRVIQVKRGKEEVGRATASVVMERLLGFIASAILVVICLGIFVLGVRRDLVPVLGVVLLVLLAGVAGLAWVLHGRLPARVARFAEAFRAYAGHRRALLSFTGLSLIEQLAPVLANYAVARALGLDLSFTAAFIIIPIVIFVVRIPISLDGLGVQEGLYVTLFAYAGLSPSESFLLSLVGRVVTLVGMLPGCLPKLGRSS
jgi:uncharacterized membrane protein YbhN (UPF0104 family)